MCIGRNIYLLFVVVVVVVVACGLCVGCSMV